jgi:hypothetical protein
VTKMILDSVTAFLYCAKQSLIPGFTPIQNQLSSQPSISHPNFSIFLQQFKLSSTFF